MNNLAMVIFYHGWIQTSATSFQKLVRNLKERKTIYILFFLLLNLILVIVFCQRFSFLVLYPIAEIRPWQIAVVRGFGPQRVYQLCAFAWKPKASSSQPEALELHFSQLVSKCISLRHSNLLHIFKISFVQNNILVTYNFIYCVATCNFDMDACGWRNTLIGDDFNWTRHKGYTPSFDTGPSTDHTTTAKSGNFICIVDQNREMIRPTLKTCQTAVSEKKAYVLQFDTGIIYFIGNIF